MAFLHVGAAGSSQSQTSRMTTRALVLALDPPGQGPRKRARVQHTFLDQIAIRARDRSISRRHPSH